MIKPCNTEGRYAIFPRPKKLKENNILIWLQFLQLKATKIRDAFKSCLFFSLPLGIFSLKIKPMQVDVFRAISCGANLSGSAKVDPKNLSPRLDARFDMGLNLPKLHVLSSCIFLKCNVLCQKKRRSFFLDMNNRKNLGFLVDLRDLIQV